MPALQPLTGEITDQLNFLEVGGNQNDLLIQRIKRSIEAIKAIDIMQYHMLNGMLYSIINDYDASVDSHEKSLRYSSEIILRQNYAYSMKRFGRTRKALELMTEVFELQPTQECFSDYTTAAIFAGIFDSIEEKLVKFAKSNPEVDVRSLPDIQYVNHIRKQMEKADVSNADYQSVLELADSVIAANRYLTTAISVESSSFDGVPYISVELGIDARSADDIVQINDGIADKVARSDIAAWDKIVVSVVAKPANKVA